ncbi:hypothetical protein DL768_001181 [Monosporascus sp. mg162]|nr:hypothetical protein DL768_001181 [Monosporascus sp. mg162]
MPHVPRNVGWACQETVPFAVAFPNNPDIAAISTELSTKKTQILKHGFGFLEKDHHTLERYSRWDVKRFYDALCELLAPSPVQ